MLHVTWMGSDAATAAIVLTHGIFGSGGNLRGIGKEIAARYLAQHGQELKVALVDLRGHGKSPNMEPPHTVAACAEDMREVLVSIQTMGLRILAVGGHSYGGKVCMLTRPLVHGVPLVWILDATPSDRNEQWHNMDNTVLKVLRILEAMPATFPTRAACSDFMREQGLSDMLVGWLAMNLQPQGDVYRFRLDAAQMNALLRDYFQCDAWPAVEAASDVVDGHIDFIIANDADTLSADDRGRLTALQNNPATSHVRVRVIENAGHWVHVDQPAALVDAMYAGLSEL